LTTFEKNPEVNYAVILLGTNLGNLADNLSRARMLVRDRAGEIRLSSSVYKTAPWGNLQQPDFLNQVISIITSLGAQELMSALHSIEKEMGRERNVRWEPRVIDLDILFFNDEVIDEAGLTIPHPDTGERLFALVPLCEILPDLRHPVSGETMSSLLEKLSGTVSGGVEKAC